MKNSRTSRALAVTLSTLPLMLSASPLVVSIESFSEATLFNIVPGSNLDLRVAELSGSPNASAATHVLIEQLSPIDDSGSLVYGSPYSALEISTGNIHDTGVLYMTLPAAPSLPAGSVASPIVGIVERSGGWNLQPVESALGGAMGSSNFDASASVLNISIERSGVQYSGTAQYSVVDDSTLHVQPFTLSSSAGNFSLSGATLTRSGMDFIGSVANQNADAGYDSLFFQMALTSIPDVDGDGIPDIVDPDVQGGQLTPGEWTQTYMGWVYGISTNWGYSNTFEWVYLYGHSAWYHPGYGAMVMIDSVIDASGNLTHAYAYSHDWGWVYTNDAFSGAFAYRASPQSSWQWANFFEYPAAAVMAFLQLR